MFLLNSRAPLVTATRGLHDPGHPLYRRYGASLPSSLAQVTPDTPWASHPGAPVSVLGTVAGFVPHRVFTGPRHQENPPKKGRPFPASPPSRHYGTPGASQVRWSDSSTPPSPRRPLLSLRCRTYTRGAGILTGFPFPSYRLGAGLGPPNPPPKTVAEEPLPLRRPGFSPGFAATTARILVPGGSTGPHGPASTPPRRSPTPWRYSTSRARVSGAGLAPSIFGARDLGG